MFRLSAFAAAWLCAGVFLPRALAAPGPPIPPAPNGPSPERVRAVLAGRLRDANAAWWGFREEDSTAALQDAIRSGAKRLFIPNMGRPWIVRPLTLASHQEIIFEPGVVLLAKEGEFHGSSDSLLTAKDAQEITLRGYGARLQMRKAEYASSAYQKAEWRMALNFMGCTNVKVYGLTLQESGGDGIYVGSSRQQKYCKNVLIQDVVCQDNYRQGISVISAENLLIENTVLRGTSGTAPAAGIDFEPNGAEERLVNCVMRHCIAAGNAGDGCVLYLAQFSADTLPVSVRLEDCRVEGSGGSGFSVVHKRSPGLRGEIELVRCSATGARGRGISIDLAPTDPLLVTLDHCSTGGAPAAGAGGTPAGG